MRKSYFWTNSPYAYKVIVCYTLYTWFISIAFSQSIEMNYQSVRFAALGHSGVGVAKEASSLYYNPAAAAMSYGNEIQFGMASYQIFTTYIGGTPSVYSALMKARPQTPFYLYGIYQPRKGGKLTLGMAVTTPFGSGIKWEDNWKGRYIVQQNHFNTISIQPTFAYRVNEYFSVGAGFVYNMGSLQFQKALPQIQFEGKEGGMFLQGKGNGIGINAGVHFRLNERVSMGISYHSRSDWKVKNGQAIFDVPSGLRIFYPNSAFNTKLIFPSKLSFGISFLPTSNTLLVLNVAQNGWQKWDSSVFNFKDSILNDIRYERNFRNTFSFSGGAEFRLLQSAFLRMGGFYHISPIKDDFVSPEMPDANKIGLTMGFGYRWKQKLSLDIMGQYDFTGDRTARFKQLNFIGTYISNSYQVGLGLKYRI